MYVSNLNLKVIGVLGSMKLFWILFLDVFISRNFKNKPENTLEGVLVYAAFLSLNKKPKGSDWKYFSDDMLCWDPGIIFRIQF